MWEKNQMFIDIHLGKPNTKRKRGRILHIYLFVYLVLTRHTGLDLS